MKATNMYRGQEPTEPGLYYRQSMSGMGGGEAPVLVSVEEIDGQLTCTSVNTFCQYPMGDDCSYPENIWWSERQTIKEVTDVTSQH